MREMGKLLSNLVEISRQTQRERAEAATKARKPPSGKKPRTPSADTRKNRQALLRSIDQRDSMGMERLIQLGVPLTFDRNGEPLLGLCLDRKWALGFELLLKAGASVDWPLDGTELSKLKCRSRWNKGQNLLEACVEDGFVEGMALCLDRFTPAQQRSAAKLSDSVEMWRGLSAKGLGDAVSDPELLSVADQLLDELDNSAEARADFSALIKARPWSPSERTRWWLMAIAKDQPAVLEFFASSGAMPESDGSASISPAHLLDQTGYSSMRSMPPEWGSTKLFKTKFTALGNQDKSFTFAELACSGSRGFDETENLKTLLPLPEFCAQVSASPFALHCLAQRRHFYAGYESLAKNGLDLSKIVDAQKRNPLHWAIEDGEAKTVIAKLARLCEPWIHQRDSNGKLPVERCDSESKAPIASLLDLIGMRESLAGRRGRSARSKRL